jgi:hypothetical protein
MRRFLPVLLIALAACANRSPVLQLGIPDDTEPMDAMIYDVDWRGVTFTVNQPAHVAVFEIVPGRGVSLVYPQYASQTNIVGAGNYTTPRGLQSGRLFYQSTTPFERYPQPRYYLLVASRYPLALGQMLSAPGAVRSVLGWQRFTDGDVYATMELLSRAIVPAYDTQFQSDSWTSDVFVVWPQSRQFYSMRSEDRLFRCANAEVYFAPWELLPPDCFDRYAYYPTRPNAYPTRRRPRTPTTPDSTMMPDTGSKGRTARPRLREGEGTPVGRVPTRPIPVQPGNEEQDRRIAGRDEDGARAPRRTGRMAFDTDPRAGSERFGSGGRRVLSTERAGRDDGLRRANVWDANRRPEGRNRRESEDAGVSVTRPSRVDRTSDRRAEPRSEPRAQPRETRAEPRSEPRAEPRSQPRSEPRSETRASETKREAPQSNRERKPPHDAR